jgi:hypothetical protein
MGDKTAQAISKGIDTLAKFTNLKDIHLCLVSQIGDSKLRNGRVKFNEPEEIDDFSYTMNDIYGNSSISHKVRATFVFIRTLLEKIRNFPNMIEDFRNLPDILKLSLLKNNEGLNDNIYLEFIKKYLDFEERPNYRSESNY